MKGAFAFETLDAFDTHRRGDDAYGARYAVFRIRFGRSVGY